MTDLESYLGRLAAGPKHAESMDMMRAGRTDRKTVLLLTCIDLRYPSVIHAHMEPKFHKLYDHVSLAGAGLSPVIDFGADRKPHWQQTFLEHVAVSIALHSISAVVVLDHRDCGAYRKFGLLRQEDNGTAKELEAHNLQVCRLAALLKREFPALAFDAALLPVEPEHDTAGGGKPPRVPVEPLACPPKS